MEPNQVVEHIEKKVVEFFNLMGLEVGIVVELSESEEEDNNRKYIQVNLEADEAGELIGKYGSRLQDLGYIFNLMIPGETREYSVVFDVNGYKKERTEVVRDIAQKYIEHAALTSTEVELEPMPAWERRIVHMQAADRTDIETYSDGEGDQRKVVIKPVSAV